MGSELQSAAQTSQRQAPVWQDPVQYKHGNAGLQPGVPSRFGRFRWVICALLFKGTYGTIMLICGSAYVIAWLIFHFGVPVIKPVPIE